MSRNRVLNIVFLLGIVVLAAAASWIAGSRIISPAEAAARTAPPTPSPILVPVEERILTSDIVTRGTARFGLPQSVSIVPSASKANAGIITSLPRQNMQIQEGDVLLTVSGRPLFVLQGEVPVFRDLTPGISGEDVRQLESGLKRLGFDPGPEDGMFDEQTSSAVSDWYASMGWEPFGPTNEQLSVIHSLEQALADAINSQLAADDALSAAPLAVDSARANAASVNLTVAADVAAKIAIRDQVMSDPNATSEDRTVASAHVEIAQAAATAAQLAGEAAIQNAINAQKSAERAASAAAGLVNQLRAELDEARREAGVQIPANEIVFLPSLPVRVDQIDAVIGDTAGGPVMTVTNNQVAIDSSLPLDEAPLVKPGMPVTIDEPDLGVSATGVVSQVAETPGTFGVDGFHIYFEVMVDETPLTLTGFSLRLTIPVETTGGAVTAVPISALSLAADGTSRVQVEREGLLEFVPVEPGLAADGFVEVTPLEETLSPGQLVVIGFESAS
jgi:peptidoglycan hydrolase-like protein with peptidoglycan-binding domain